MKAAILCPGPSLIRTWDDDFGGLVVAVNRAATRFPCDTWACGDWPAIQRDEANVIGNPMLLVALSGLPELAAKGVWRARPFITFEDLFTFLHPTESQTAWTLLTATAAIVYAASRGATEIEVHGADWRGVEDWDGVEAGGNRSDERWKLEREVFAALKGNLAERGVRVDRIKAALAR